MADLDNFFAKSDKKKKKKKAPVVAGELLETKREEEKVKEKKRIAKSNESQEPVSAVMRKNQEDEEWEDFEEQKEADLADLKLKNLSLKAKMQTAQQNSGDADDGEDTGVENRTVQSSGVDGEQESPWNKAQADAVADEEAVSSDARQSEAPPPVDSSVAAEREAKLDSELDNALASGKYVPPSLRRRADGGGESGGGSEADVFKARPLHVGGPRRTKAAPNIKNESEFPELGVVPAAPPTPVDDNKGRFETVERSNPNRYIPPSMRDGGSRSSAPTYSSSRNDDYNSSSSSRYPPSGSSSSSGAWSRRDAAPSSDGAAGPRSDLSVSNRWAALRDDV